MAEILTREQAARDALAAFVASGGDVLVGGRVNVTLGSLSAALATMLEAADELGVGPIDLIAVNCDDDPPTSGWIT